MSHLYVFCAAAGAVAYGVGVAVGKWVQKNKMLEGIKDTEITLDQFRYLEKEIDELDKQVRVYRGRSFDAEYQAQTAREQLISTHNALMAAYSELELKRPREHASYTSTTVAVPADERPVCVLHQKSEYEFAEEVLSWHEGAWWRRDPASGRFVERVTDGSDTGWKEVVE